MKISCIYKIQSQLKPEKIYIGSAVDIKNRWSKHLTMLRKGTHKNSKLQNHYNKYNEEDFVLIIIEPCFPEFLTIREQYYLDKLNPSFNICKIAGSSLGVKRSEAFKEKMRNRIFTPEHREKLSAWQTGIPKTEESKRINSESNKGRKDSDEIKANKRKAQNREGVGENKRKLMLKFWINKKSA